MAFKVIHYKPDQGRYTRGVALGLLICLAYYGAVTLFQFLAWDWFRKELGFTVPVLEVPTTPGLLIAVVAFLAMAWGLRYAVNHPKLADLLIDTEGELKRVTWPSWPDTWTGSIVVVITVVAMLAILASFDFALNRIFSRVVFG
jgi:preprotein translocase SecE subunit